MDRHPWRKRRLDSRQLRPDRIGNLDQIGLGLSDDADCQRPLAVEPECAPIVLRTELNAAHIGELHQPSALARHCQRAEFLRGLELTE